MRRVPVRGIDGDSVAAGLERQGDVDNEAFCAANAEVGMDDGDIGGVIARFCCGWHGAGGREVMETMSHVFLQTAL